MSKNSTRRNTTGNSRRNSDGCGGSDNNFTNRQQTNPDEEIGLPQSSSSPSVSFQTPPRTTSPLSPRTVSFADEVSPSDTFDTALTSASTRTFDTAATATPSSNASFSTNKIIIDHNINTTASSQDGNKGGGSRGRGGGGVSAGLIFGMSKPILAVVMLGLLGAGGAAALGWLQIPGLKDQIQALEQQVLRLSAEVTRLSLEVDRLEDENDRYAGLNDQLNATVDDLGDVRDDLNGTSASLADQVDELREQNLEYASLTEGLNRTVLELSEEVSYFKGALADLATENEILANRTVALQNLSDQLSNTTLQQNETLVAMQETLQNYTAENDRLVHLNNDLVTLVQFLNDTSSGLGNSLENITSFLSDQINANQALVLESLENTYRQRVQSWDCEYGDVFPDDAFGRNFSAPMNRATELPAVLDYVDQRVLSELCLEGGDFATFLDAAYPEATDEVVTSYRLMRAVRIYVDLALDYYFPEANETGLPLDDWTSASFKCEQLPAPFAWTSTPSPQAAR